MGSTWEAYCHSPSLSTHPHVCHQVLMISHPTICGCLLMGGNLCRQSGSWVHGFHICRRKQVYIKCIYLPLRFWGYGLALRTLVTYTKALISSTCIPGASQQAHLDKATSFRVSEKPDLKVIRQRAMEPDAHHPTLDFTYAWAHTHTPHHLYTHTNRHK